MGLVCSLSCAFFLPFGAGHAVTSAGRAPPGTRSAGPLGSRRCIPSSGPSRRTPSSALFTRQPLGRARDLSAEQLRQNQPTAPWLLPRMVRGWPGWHPPAPLNSFPALLCLACSRLPWRQAWLGAGPRGWAVAISLASPAHPARALVPGTCRQPPSPQGAQPFSGTSCAGHFHIHWISLGP